MFQLCFDYETRPSFNYVSTMIQILQSQKKSGRMLKDADLSSGNLVLQNICPWPSDWVYACFSICIIFLLGVITVLTDSWPCSKLWASVWRMQFRQRDNVFPSEAKSCNATLADNVRPQPLLIQIIHNDLCSRMTATSFDHNMALGISSRFFARWLALNWAWGLWGSWKVRIQSQIAS